MQKLSKFEFNPISRDDKDVLLEWFARPHFREWWGEPEEEWALVEEALDTHEAIMFWADQNGEHLAYIQYWPVALARGKVEAAEEIWLASLSDETIGVDISLGNTGDLGKGLGREIMREFVAKLEAQGFRDIIIDPDIRNRRAIKSYMAAGFVRIGQYPEEIGGTLLMRWAGAAQSEI